MGKNILWVCRNLKSVFLLLLESAVFFLHVSKCCFICYSTILEELGKMNLGQEVQPFRDCSVFVSVAQLLIYAVVQAWSQHGAKHNCYFLLSISYNSPFPPGAWLKCCLYCSCLTVSEFIFLNQPRPLVSVGWRWNGKHSSDCHATAANSSTQPSWIFCSRT